MRWVPLEANPEIFQQVSNTARGRLSPRRPGTLLTLSIQWTTSLGLDSHSGEFCDIYGLDPELL